MVIVAALQNCGWMLQVVDMRWGVRDDAADDHITTALCMEELENCKHNSVGLNFVVSEATCTL